jgi:FAD/FMN-containing dehydrogenase
MKAKPSPETLNRLAAVVGDKHAIRDAVQMDGYLREWRQIWHGRSPLVLRPASTDEVSRILSIANETGTAIVPQAGNTGLCGGQIPTDDGHEVVLSLDRMTRILDVDPPTTPSRSRPARFSSRCRMRPPRWTACSP